MIGPVGPDGSQGRYGSAGDPGPKGLPGKQLNLQTTPVVIIKYVYLHIFNPMLENLNVFHASKLQSMIYRNS